MGQHVTLHGKTNEEFNGQDGKWVPVRVSSTGQLLTPLISGEFQQFNRLAAGTIFQATKLTASGIVSTTPTIFYGIKVLVAGSAGSLVAYDATSALGGSERTETLAFGAATAGTMLRPGQAGEGLIHTVGLYVTVPTGATVLVYTA